MTHQEYTLKLNMLLKSNLDDLKFYFGIEDDLDVIRFIINQTYHVNHERILNYKRVSSDKLKRLGYPDT